MSDTVVIKNQHKNFLYVAGLLLPMWCKELLPQSVIFVHLTKVRPVFIPGWPGKKNQASR